LTHFILRLETPVNSISFQYGLKTRTIYEFHIISNVIYEGTKSLINYLRTIAIS